MGATYHQRIKLFPKQANYLRFTVSKWWPMQFPIRPIIDVTASTQFENTIYTAFLGMKYLSVPKCWLKVYVYHSKTIMVTNIYVYTVCGLWNLSAAPKTKYSHSNIASTKSWDDMSIPMGFLVHKRSLKWFEFILVFIQSILWLLLVGYIELFFIFFLVFFEIIVVLKCICIVQCNLHNTTRSPAFIHNIMVSNSAMNFANTLSTARHTMMIPLNLMHKELVKFFEVFKYFIHTILYELVLLWWWFRYGHECFK